MILRAGEDLHVAHGRKRPQLACAEMRLQKARGYRATIVSGAVTYRDGEAIGALPGKLLRGARQAA